MRWGFWGFGGVAWLAVAARVRADHDGLVVDFVFFLSFARGMQGGMLHACRGDRLAVFGEARFEARVWTPAAALLDRSVGMRCDGSWE